MTRIYCDRCGEVIPTGDIQRWPVPERHDDGWHSRTVDLCPVCMKVLADVVEVLRGRVTATGVS